MAAKKSDVDAKGKKVLGALAKGEGPMTNKQIAGASGLESKEVSAVVKSLKDLGLVDSPARCKYGITDAGKKQV